MYIANATHNEKAHYSKAVLNFCCGAVIKITSPANNVHLHRTNTTRESKYKLCHIHRLHGQTSIVPTVFISSLTSRGDLCPFRECSDPGCCIRSFPPQWKWNCRTVYLCFRPPPRTPAAPAFSSHSTAGKHGADAGVFVCTVHTVGYTPASYLCVRYSSASSWCVED